MKNSNKPIKDFSQLKYLLATGNTPDEKMPREKHERWQIEYNGRVIEYNFPYPVCVNKVKVYKQFSHIYPNKTLFKITPYLNK